MANIFITAINCIDGRVQEPLTEFAIKKFKADYVDLITEPGPDKILSENKAADIVASIKRRTLISIEKHNSKIIIIVGHYDCAASPGEKKEHFRQIKKAVSTIKEWKIGVKVYGVWVGENLEAEFV